MFSWILFLNLPFLFEIKSLLSICWLSSVVYQMSINFEIFWKKIIIRDDTSYHNVAESFKNRIDSLIGCRILSKKGILQLSNCLLHYQRKSWKIDRPQNSRNRKIEKIEKNIWETCQSVDLRSANSGNSDLARGCKNNKKESFIANQ